MAEPIRVTTAPGAVGAAQAMQVAPMDTSVWNQIVGGSIDSVRVEIDDAFADMKTFYNNEPDHCMRKASGHAARLSELRVRIARVEDWAPGWTQVRVRELEPALQELKAQYENASRRHSVRELDWKMESGGDGR